VSSKWYRIQAGKGGALTTGERVIEEGWAQTEPVESNFRFLLKKWRRYIKHGGPRR
jgi:hypothetical protein